MARKKKEESAPGAPLWLVTYGDMVTLVLTFFVLLFSFLPSMSRSLK
jgi:chemotaxis protein MotB